MEIIDYIDIKYSYVPLDWSIFKYSKRSGTEYKLEKKETLQIPI